MTDNYLTRKQFFAVLASDIANDGSDITITITPKQTKKYPTLHTIDLQTIPDVDRISMATSHPRMDIPATNYTYEQAINLVRAFLTIASTGHD